MPRKQLLLLFFDLLLFNIRLQVPHQLAKLEHKGGIRILLDSNVDVTHDRNQERDQDQYEVDHNPHEQEMEKLWMRDSSFFGIYFESVEPLQVELENTQEWVEKQIPWRDLSLEIS